MPLMMWWLTVGFGERTTSGMMLLILHRVIEARRNLLRVKGEWYPRMLVLTGCVRQVLAVQAAMSALPPLRMEGERSLHRWTSFVAE